MNLIYIGKKNFHKNPLYFWIITEFEADNEIDKSSVGKKTTKNYRQNPVCNGFYIVSALNDVLKSGYYSSILDYDIEDWFVNEIIKIENKIVFYFENIKKDVIMTEDEKDYGNNNICRYCTKNVLNDKVRNHCHLTGKYRKSAHNNCNINVTQKKLFYISSISQV